MMRTVPAVVVIAGLLGSLMVGCGRNDVDAEADVGIAEGPGAPGPMGPMDGPPGAPDAPPAPGPPAQEPAPGPPDAPAAPTPAPTPTPTPVEVPEADVPDVDVAEVPELVRKARAAKNAGDLDTALKLVTDAIRVKPQDTDANWVAAWILAQKRDTALAIGQFERTLKLGLQGKRANEARAAVKRLKAREE